jgi:hypothetical protein
MGYFSNGSEGDCYRALYCDRCEHSKQEYDETLPRFCPIWEAHLLFCYDGTKEQHNVLDMLIPRDGRGHNAECRMFTPRALRGEEVDRG